MKKFFVFLFIIVFSACSKTEKNVDKKESINTTESKISSTLSSNGKEKRKRIEYKYDYMDGYKRDDSLYVDRMLGDYPANIISSEDSPYKKDELKNLDYNKNISFSMFNIRIPKRCMVFSKEKEYVIAFPKSEDYDISIKMKNLLKDGEKSEEEIKKDLYKIADKKSYDFENDKTNLIQKPILLESEHKKSAYSIAEDNKYSYTNIFMATPTNIIEFQITEDKEKSDYSPYIMADLLSTTYSESEDTNIVEKSFKDYDNDINIYATEKIDMGDFSFNIPKSMKNIQESKQLTVYENQIAGKTINQVLISKIKKGENMDINRAFALSQGSKIPPAFISPMGRVKEEIVLDKLFLKSKVRIYTEQFSLEGEKISFETEDYFVNIIVTGPLKNTNKTDLLNSNIINSLEFK